MGWTVRAAGAALCAALGLAAPATAMSHQGGDADFGKQQAAAEVRDLARWTMRTADHAGLPFAIVDKKNAHIYVFDRAGRLRGASPVLLGQAIGDDSAPDVGEHAQTGRVPLQERTTPAGRFVSEPGRNRQGEQVVWVDYQSAFAIHRLRPGRPTVAAITIETMSAASSVSRKTMMPVPSMAHFTTRWPRAVFALNSPKNS